MARTIDTACQQTARLAFLRWQTRVRQIAMRDRSGQPDEAAMPSLTLFGQNKPMGHIVTVLSKLPQHSITPEMQHIYRSTADPAQRRQKAIKFFSATHYQKAATFCDTLTATFPPGSPGARAICAAGACALVFEAYGQRFDLPCQVSVVEAGQALFQATWWHNALFNPNLASDTVILGFTPDWPHASADPAI
ncbi:hypothetical protein MNBD_ALPHA09-2001 [hydrothermal vent metagenome]|uniref:Uncharacterized protein n=1 Tax=hydrothermal vent metagenome TaxID=652676 RepID=A0A3B0TRH5_9ZZZZ